MDKMGGTAGIPPNGIIYTGTRDDLQRKLRERDDRITELESALRKIADPISWLQSQLAEGEQLDWPAAYALSVNPSWLREAARESLRDQ